MPASYAHTRRLSGTARAVLLAFWCATSPARAQTCIDYADFIHTIGEYPDSEMRALAIYGNTVYACSRDRIRILDVSDPHFPRLIADCSVGTATDIANLGPILFVTVGSRLHVVDAREPASPVVLASLEMPGYAEGVTLALPRAYIACTDAGVVVVDISDFEHPRVIGRANTPGRSLDVALVGSIAYIADYDQGVTVVDFSDPVVPAFLPSLGGSEPVQECEVRNGSLFVGRGSFLETWDLTNPERPSFRSSISAETGLLHGLAAGDAFVIAGSAVFDITTGQTRLGARAPVPRIVRDIEIQGDIAYFTSYGNKGGLFIVQMNPGENPPQLGSIMSSSVGVRAFGGYAYVLESSAVGIYDYTDPRSPLLLGNVSLEALGYDIEVSRDLAWVACGHRGLHVLDISNPRSPVPVVRWESTGQVQNLALEGSLAYLAMGSNVYPSGPWNGVVIADVSIPSAPVELARVPTTFGVQAVDVLGGYVYAGALDTLHVIDVSNPAVPRHRARLWLEEPSFGINVTGLHATGTFVYVAFAFGLSGTLAIVDITDAELPTLVASIRLSERAEAVHEHQGVAYVADGQQGVQLIDVRDPRMPRRIGYAAIPFNSGSSRDVWVSDDLLFLATEPGAMRIFPAQCALQTPVILSDFDAKWVGDGITIRAHLAENVDRIAVLRADNLELREPRTVYESRAIGSGDWEFVDRAANPSVTYAYAVEIDFDDTTWRSEPVVVPGRESGGPRLRVASRHPASGPVELRYEVSRAIPVRLDVYDVSGRIVRDILQARSQPGSHSVTWDGRDRDGRNVAAGMYIVRLDAGGESRSVRVIQSH